MAIIKIPWETATNKDLLKVGTLRKIFDTTVRAAKTVSDRLFRMETTDQWEEVETRMAGLDQAQEIVEGQNIPIQTPQRGTDKTYTQRIFGTGFRMTYAMDWANKYSLFRRWAKDLGKVMTESKDVELAVLWNNTTSTTLTCGVGFDTLALANAAHTGLLPGSTADNYNNYGNVGLSYTALKTMRYYFKTLTDDMGMWMGLQPDTLYYEPTLWPTVTEFFGATGQPGTFSNDINLVPKMGITPYEYPRLSSTTAWGVCATKDDLYDVKCRTGLAPKFFTKDAPDSTQDKLIVAMQFFTYGWGDPRAVWVGKT
jgi:hypothetical protein